MIARHDRGGWRAKPRDLLRCLMGYGVGLWPAWLAWRAEGGDRSYLSKPRNPLRCLAGYGCGRGYGYG